MSDRRNPGPPLTAEEEFCACQPPTTGEYVRAFGAAFLLLIAGAGLWLGLVLLFQRISAASAVPIAAGVGWAIHRAAGRHRSLALGILAAVSAILATLAGFALLWLPAFARLPLARQLDWYHLAMLGLGALFAFSLAGPRERGAKSL